MTRTGWLKSFAVLLPAALCLAAFGACGGGGEPEDAPVAAPPPKEEPSEPAPERAEPEPVRRRPAPPATGGLQVSGTAGAIVFLDGREIGTVPGAWEEMDAGEYPLRVEKQGFHPFEATVTIRGGRVRSVAAELAERLGSIRVESDVPAAMVFLDRAFKGNTPVTIESVRPGSYTLTVSAEGYEVDTRRVEVERTMVPVRVELGERVDRLEARVPVTHKHRFGSCRGELEATAAGFRYRTEHKDRFELDFANVERFELDYLENNLRLKVRGGRTYNFESPTEDLDGLFVFHRDVTAFRESGSIAPGHN